MQVQTKSKNMAEIRCKIGLLVFLLLGAALIAAGLWGIDQFNQSGFDQEVAYGYSYRLSSALDAMYEKGIQPVLHGMDDKTKTDIEQRSRELLIYSWTEAVGEDCTATVDTYLQDSDDPAREQMELLAIS